MPAPGHQLGAVGFEAILTFGIVLLVLAFGTMGGPYNGAAFNPARAFGPDVALGDLSTYWVYPLGSLVGSAAAVLVAGIFRGAATAQEAQAALGTPLDRDGTIKAS